MPSEMAENNSSPRSTASTPRDADPRRKSLNGRGRACDRCRRRKARCDATSPRHRCSLCRQAGESCTYDLPMARRGPKAKKRNEGLASADSSVLSIPAEHDPTLAFTSPNANVLPELPSSTTSRNPTANLTIDHVLSPQTVHSVASESWPSATANAIQRWHELSRALALSSFDVEWIVSRCLDLFFQYLYPLTPLVHEPILRNGLAYFISRTATNMVQSPRVEPNAGIAASAQIGDSWTGIREPWLESTFTLITAVCAEAAFLLPQDLFPEGDGVGETFLKASRNCLNSYLEADLEAPNASSIAIRYFHSNCVHAAGKPKYSWHIFGEATRLAQVMQLHEESSLEGLLPIEAELRRRAFWIVYMGDKSAAILNNRPITIHRFSFESPITIAYPSGLEDEAPVGRSPGNEPTLSEAGRKCLINGFNANLRLWQAASDLLLEMRVIQEAQRPVTSTNNLTAAPMPVEHRQRLDDLYVQFITCLDDLPPYLQSYNLPVPSDSGPENARTNQFIIQRANLQVSLHCLRMVIAQKSDMAYLATSAEQANLCKTEIARDMLKVMHEAPFWSLQVNGEPYVEKIRLIGASLLAIIHRYPGAHPLAARARSDFLVLLDILTRLDSKASDALRGDLNSRF
ncbi:transcription factor domain-containing protein [Aspergillus lucknowensis]|uniref:Zn(2)-C6 fungal-type domain-containing protein n=1 Tax=Aspergillus lucknowensis TaxID=176173 RepID=A0ABR4LR53_9EURO